MQITANQLTSGQSSLNAQTQATASIAPGGNRLIIATVMYQRNSGSSAAPTLTGNGLTWVQVLDRQNSGDTNNRITVFRAMGGSPSSGAITIDFGSSLNAHVHWNVSEFINADTSGSNGANAVVQSTFTEQTGSTSSIAVTLNAFQDANNATHGVACSPTALTKGANFTELSNNATSSTPDLSAEAEWANNNQTNVNWTYGSTTGAKLAAAIEIKAALDQGGDYAYLM